MFYVQKYYENGFLSTFETIIIIHIEHNKFNTVNQLYILIIATVVDRIVAFDILPV